MTDVTFAALGVAEPILRALAAENYTHPTPIQARAIPALAGGPRSSGHRPDRHRQDRRFRPAAAAEAFHRPCAAPPARSQGPDPGADPRTGGADRAEPAHLWPLPQSQARRDPGRRQPERPGQRHEAWRGHPGGDAGPSARPGAAEAYPAGRGVRSSSSTKPTACWTWASSAMCARSWRICRKRTAVDAVLRHHARRYRQAGGRHAAIARAHRSDAAGQDRRPHRAEALLCADAAEAPAAGRAAEGSGDEPRHRLHPHQAWRQPGGRASDARTASRPTPFTATSPRMPASARWKCSAPARSGCWWRPTSPPAASTSTTSPMW